MTCILLGLVAAALAALAAWRAGDVRFEKRTWQDLVSWQPASARRFDPSTLKHLPEPVQRFFRFAIAPGTPIAAVAEIGMTGELGLGSKDRPNYQRIRAEQILAPPHGFVWRVRTRSGLRLAGSDGATDGSSWSRFWLYGIVPVARAGGNPDHLRSSFGRCIAEALFWTPAALLPAEHVAWEVTGDDSARVTVAWNGLEQAIDLRLDADGRPTQVSFLRLSNANPEKVFRLQPFGGYLSGFRNFAGYRLPTRIEAGNFFATKDYFPFFRVEVTSLRFPTPTNWQTPGR